MRFLRWTIVLMLCLGAALPVAAAEVVIDLWDGITATDGQGIDKFVAMFNEEYEGKYHVNRMSASWDELYPKLAVAVAAGAGPDVMIMHRDRIPEQALNGTIAPIDRFFIESGLTDEDFLPGLAQEFVYQGQRYGVPLDIHCALLYWNVDHFQEAGLSRAPANSEEFVTFGKKLTLQKNGEITRYATRITSWEWPIYGALRQFGVEYYGGPNKDQVDVDSEAGVAALAHINDLVNVYKIATDWPWADMFKGEVSMNVDGIWWLRLAQDNRRQGKINLQVAPMDRLFGDVEAAAPAGSHTLTMPVQENPDPKRQEAAWAFIKFVSDHNVEWAPWGQLPARLDAVRSPEFQDMKDHLLIAQQTFAFWPLAPWGTGGGQLSKAVEPMLKGEISPKEAAEQAAKGLIVYMNEMKAKMKK